MDGGCLLAHHPGVISRHFTVCAVAGRIACLAALLLLSTASAWADVSMDSSAKISASSVATATIPLFVTGASGNRVLVVGLTFGQGAPAAVVVKYGGVNLTLVPGTSKTQGNAHTEIWSLLNPSSTPSNIVATWTANHDVVMGAMSFSGVNQVTPVINGTSASAAASTAACRSRRST